MSLAVVQRLPEDHPAWKDLRPFGYECARWLKAMAMLQARWRKGRFGDSLNAFLNEWLPQEEVVSALPETFEITFDQGRIGGDSVFSPVAQPVWHALLHLPSLHDFWMAELRASHYEHLLKMIPQAWCMDPTPLPPGSVIAGLGITSWDELPRFIESGHRFNRHHVGENKVVLSAASTIGNSWLARYALRDGQITLEDAFLH